MIIKTAAILKVFHKLDMRFLTKKWWAFSHRTMMDHYCGDKDFFCYLTNKGRN